MIAAMIMTAACAAASLCGCGRNTAASRGDVTDKTIIPRATFTADSAYAYVSHQVAMGPRVAGTPTAHACAGWLASELTRHGADTVKLQRATITAYNGDRLDITNVMGSYNTPARRRIMLVAHYDSRPWADSDADPDNLTHPVPGANDGASGVGTILEIARHLGQDAPPVGVDILLVDAEDYGQTAGFSNHDETWGLGTQYWTAHMPYAPDSLPAYAILLDMVGGQDAKFHREYFSHSAAPAVVDKIWGIAARSGYGDRFINQPGGAIVDDHVFLNKAGIPAVDIIESKNDVTKSFPPTWHTLDDDLTNIDRTSLQAAGQTVLNVIYTERP